jgi:diaminopimelate decarboxylase
MELDLALRLRVPGRRILFNGPLKSADDIGLALAGAQVNVDALEEIAAIEAIAARHPDVPLRVGLRCHSRGGRQVVALRAGRG